MANVIKLKRGSGSDPSASDLVVGEVAIRTDSGKLFTKKDNGTIAEISGSGGGSDIFINTLSSSSGSGGGSATFNGTATRFTLSNPPSVSAQQLLVSINGVVQKPNSGTSPSEGFAIDGNDIIFAAAPATGSDFFIVTYGSLNIAVPADNSVTSAKIVDGTIVGTDLATNIDLTDSQKIRFGNSQDLQLFHDGNNSVITAGGAGDLQLTSTFDDVIIQAADNIFINPQGGEDGLKVYGDGAVELYFDNSRKLHTRSDGINLIGDLDMTDADNYKINLGASSDLQLYHDGSSSRIIAANHDLIVQSNGYAIRSENGSSTFAIIDSSGNVGIGTSPDSILHIAHVTTPLLSFTSTDTSLAQDQLIGGIKTFKSDASGSGTGIAGGIFWRSDDSYGARSYIQFTNRQNSTGQTNTDTECMRIKSNGDVSITHGNLVVAAGHGIDFSANPDAGGMTAENLNDYEEGTWTPLWGGGLTATSYRATYGGYTKIGNIVTFTLRIEANGGQSTSGAAVLITGLPFTVKSVGATHGAEGSASTGYQDIYIAGYGDINVYVYPSQTYLLLHKVGAALYGTDLTNTGGTLHLSGWYPTDA